MIENNGLLLTVNTAFGLTGASFTGWPNPHEGHGPSDEEYSRLTDPDRWLILGARVDAWVETLVRLNLATVERDAEVEWKESPRLEFSRVDRVTPLTVGALPVIVARSSIGGVYDAVISIGVGDPAISVVSFPDCGCDACDSGSEYELNQLDEWLIGLVSGVFRRLTKGNRVIIVHDNNGWSGSNLRRRDRVTSILQNPKGWTELRGVSWLSEASKL